MWTQAEAIELARHFEPIANQYNYHVALTGGTLYKDGPRKDADLVFYSHGSKDNGNPFFFERDIVLGKFPEITGWTNRSGRVMKITFKGKPVDLIFPEEDGEYDEESDE